MLCPHGSGASFQIADVSAFFGYDQRAFELPGIGGIDPEISGKFHRAANAFGYIDERTIGKNGRIQSSKILITGRHNRRSEEHTSELQSLMRISYADLCLKKK